MERTAMKRLAWLVLVLMVDASQPSGARLSAGEPLDNAPADQSAGPADADQSAASWVKVCDKAAFSPRDTSEDLVFNDKMWLSNGYHHGNVLSRDLWCSSGGVTWTLVNAETPYDGYSEMVAYEDKMWAVKGSVWNSTDGVNWQKVTERTPFGSRGYGELVVHGGKMWQLGSGQGIWHSTDGKDWTCAVKVATYGPRAASAVVVFNNRLWLMGGRVTNRNRPPEKGYEQYTTFNDVWSSADGVGWERVLEHAPWAPRMWFISKVYADRMWIIGGYDNVNHKNFGDVWYSGDGVHWHEFRSRTSFEPRHEPTCYIFKKSLWVVAGNTWPVRNDVWRLTLP